MNTPRDHLSRTPRQWSFGMADRPKPDRRTPAEKDPGAAPERLRSSPPRLRSEIRDGAGTRVSTPFHTGKSKYPPIAVFPGEWREPSPAHMLPKVRRAAREPAALALVITVAALVALALVAGVILGHRLARIPAAESVAPLAPPPVQAVAPAPVLAAPPPTSPPARAAAPRPVRAAPPAVKAALHPVVPRLPPPRRQRNPSNDDAVLEPSFQ